jgi:hypothetical protein
MLTTSDTLECFSMCFEWFLFGNISVLLFVPLLLIAKEVQLFPGLGLYSGIFAIYLQCPSNNSRTANIVFYIICLLYVLCAAAVFSDILRFIFAVSNNSICKNIIFIINCTVLFWWCSTFNWLTANYYDSHCNCPTHIKCLLWLHLPMHHSTHKPFNLMLYISSVLFT